jgi:hypothetical protein
MPRGSKDDLDAIGRGRSRREQKTAFELLTKGAGLTQPVAVIHSPAEIIAAWPITAAGRITADDIERARDQHTEASPLLS